MYWCYSMFMLIIYKQMCHHMMQHMYTLFLTLQRWVDDFHFPQNYKKNECCWKLSIEKKLLILIMKE